MATQHGTIGRLLKDLDDFGNVAIFGEPFVGKNWQSRECAEILECLHAP